MQILENKKAIIFDLDGTLVDSMWMWGDIDVEYLARYGYTLPKHLQKEIEGMSFSETAIYFKERFQIPDSLDTIKQDWLDMAEEKYRHETPLKDGADRLLKKAAAQGIKLGIASSNSGTLIDTVLEARGIRSCFHSVRNCCEVSKGKPAPDIYLLVAKDLGVAPEECLVFEDIPMGILAGKNAGMETCAVYDSFSVSQDDEKRKLADYYIHTYHDLFDGSVEVLD